MNRVLDILVQEGILDPKLLESSSSEALFGTTKRTHRQHVIHELVQTERTYVQHLEMLQEFKKAVEEQGVIPGDAVHDIFLNLNSLLDFQRRFLIRVEQTNDKPEDEQNWGALFVLYKDAFKVYEPYIANQKKCEEIAMLNFSQLRTVKCSPELRSMVDSQTVLTSFLLKPFQRLSKYPLLLRELRDKGDLDDALKADIDSGINAAQAALLAANDAVDLEERTEAVLELRERVEDWKGHRLDAFGELLLYGTFSVIKGDPTTSKGEEREVYGSFKRKKHKKTKLTESQYKIYLFENILLCCKEMQSTKKKNTGKQLQDRKGRPKLQLKGRIFMQNVTDTIVTSKPGGYHTERDIWGHEVTVAFPGSYTCQIFWKGDPGIEFFTIRFTTEETLRKWAEQVESQRRDHNSGRRSNQTGTTSVSTTQFDYLRNLQMDNPYIQDDDDDDDAAGTLVDSRASYSIGRNESNTSLPSRSRSATGESGPPMGGRVPPRQFPLGAQAPVLQVRTQQPPMSQQQGTASPNEWIMDSYFSPTAESPISTRSSGQSGMFPFPRQAMPNGWVPDEHARFTAPAIPRQQSRDGSMNGYPATARNAMQRPSLPPSAAFVGHMPQNRMRSASSPDIQPPGLTRRVVEPGSQPGVPELPPFPQHYAYQPSMLNRNQSTTPQAMGLPGPVGITGPVRSATSSPMTQRVPSRGGTSPYPIGTVHPPPMPRATPMGSIDRTITPLQPEMRSMTPASVDSSLRPVTPGSTASSGMLASGIPPVPSQPSGQNLPSQLKIKVHCPSAGSSMVLVVPSNISYQSLKDRIDAKLQRSTNLSLTTGSVRLKYLDDDDYVSIQSDEDVAMAFETWKEQSGPGAVGAGMYPEIELYCQ